MLLWACMFECLLGDRHFTAAGCWQGLLSCRWASQTLQPTATRVHLSWAASLVATTTPSAQTQTRTSSGTPCTPPNMFMLSLLKTSWPHSLSWTATPCRRVLTIDGWWPVSTVGTHYAASCAVDMSSRMMLLFWFACPWANEGYFEVYMGSERVFFCFMLFWNAGYWLWVHVIANSRHSTGYFQ